MNQSFVFATKRAVLDQILNSTRQCLEIAWKITVFTLALIILIEITVGPGTQSEHLSSQEPQPVRVERTENLVRIHTRLPAGKDTLQVDLIDPLGRKHLHLAYGVNGLTHWFTPNPTGFHLGYVKQPGGGEAFNIRVPRASYSIGLESSGESRVTVVDPLANQRLIGEILVSSDGKLRPPRDEAEVPR